MNKKYQRKSTEVTATQWFELGDHPAVFLSYKNSFLQDSPTFTTKFGDVIVSSGDWIVEINGQVKILKDEYFRENYVEIVERPISKLLFVADCV